MVPHETLEKIADGYAVALLDGVRYRKITLDLTTGFKYQLRRRVEWRIRTKGLKILQDYEHPRGYYGCRTDGTIWGNPGCGYDGPTKFPDVDWMMLPSLVHDILHWLIALGIVSQLANNLIDNELGLIVRIQHFSAPTWFGRRWRVFRSWYTSTSTHLVWQKREKDPHPRRIIEVWVPDPSPVTH